MALGQRRHQPPDLLGRAVGQQRQRPRARVHGDGDRGAGVGAGQLLEHEHVAEEVGPGAAVLGGDAHAHEPELAQGPEDVGREMVLAVPRGRPRRDLLVGEPARQRTDVALLVAENAHAWPPLAILARRMEAA